MLVRDRAVGVLIDQLRDVVGVLTDDRVGRHREQHVGHAGGFDEVDEVALEVADVEHVDLLEGARVERDLRVAVAVLDDEQLAAVRDAGVDLDDVVVAAEEHHVGVRGIHLGEEVVAVQVVERGVVVVRLVVRARHVVLEVLRVVQQAGILREAVHRADIALVDALFVHGQVGKGYAGGFGEGAGRIVGAERLPVVVGAQVDVFLGVLLHHVDDVDGADAVVELCGDVVKAFALVGDVFQRVFRRVDRARGRRRHRPDRHIGADLALQLVERARVVGAGAAAEGLHAAPVAVPVDHQQIVDPLQRAVFLRRVVALVGLVRGADGLCELRKDLAAGNAFIRVRRRRGRRRGFGFFARILVVLRSGADRGEQAHAKG